MWSHNIMHRCGISSSLFIVKELVDKTRLTCSRSKIWSLWSKCKWQLRLIRLMVTIWIIWIWILWWIIWHLWIYWLLWTIRMRWRIWKYWQMVPWLIRLLLSIWITENIILIDMWTGIIVAVMRWIRTDACIVRCWI